MSDYAYASALAVLLHRQWVAAKLHHEQRDWLHCVPQFQLATCVARSD